jgi:transcription-repair coupling factor (superfamily II helicase)
MSRQDLRSGNGRVIRKEPKQKTGSARIRISSSSPLGLLALHLLARWGKSETHGIVFVAETEARAERLGAVIHDLAPTSGVLVLPGLNTLPFDRLEPSREIAGRRSAVLRRLAKPKRPVLLVTTPEAMMTRLPAPANWAAIGFHLRVGDIHSEATLRKRLEGLGYDPEDTPDYPGGVLFNGQTFEIFPAGALSPYRVEMSQGKIRRIASYNPVGQEIVSEVEELVIDPMSERLAHKKRTKQATLLDYCAGAEWIADAGVSAKAEGWLGRIDEAGSATDIQREYLDRKDWSLAAKRMRVLPLKAPYDAPPDFSKLPSPGKSLRTYVSKAQKDGARLVFVSAHDDDLRSMERMSGVRLEPSSDWRTAIGGRAGNAAVSADFDRGFVIRGRKAIIVITATDVLGSRAHHPQPMVRAWASTFAHTDVPQMGGIVVHLQRGLARLAGMQTIATNEIPAREMIRLEFAGNDAALVPPSELGVIWPYASELGDLSLDKADGTSWQARRSEAEKEIDDVAKRLSRQIDQRRRRRAPKIVAPSERYEKFVARFPYSATPDQLTAIEHVLNDLASGHPMDRIVCGDVGFGKTEVALRAAAATVFAGKQVAVAVPTTVLARQHVATFGKRFAPFGIEVEYLSRFSSAAQAREALERLASGAAKIVIGTQALVSKRVEFADLGLVIVDEEQHFGVNDKAKFSALSENVHTLWMSATPIPRTLSAGLFGLRDLSLIASPPVARAPIATRIAPLSDAAIAAPLLREQRRGGQSFLVCPRISDLDPMLARVRSAAPELRISCIHGKMAAREIDERMITFLEGDADVLLATNIVESGLDIPRANTIIVCWPEKFGLAQLHQLRGRVGRGGTRAFAHFLTEAESSQAEKRLTALREFDGPGAGFAVSARDMDLRGTGDLFSEQQSGHVQVFGPALYNHLLKLAMAGNGSDKNMLWIPELNLPLPELLPPDYVKSETVRLELYSRAAKAGTREELDALEREALRRFARPPQAAREFFDLARLRLICRERGVVKLDVGPEAIAATLLAGSHSKRISRRLKRDGDRVIYSGGGGDPPLKRVEEFFDLLS